MKIKMLKTARGQDTNKSGCALPVEAYIAGKVYEVGESLGEAFLGSEHAVKASDKPAPAENKDAGAAPENKKKKGKTASKKD